MKKWLPIAVKICIILFTGNIIIHAFIGAVERHGPVKGIITMGGMLLCIGLLKWLCPDT